MGAVSNRVRIRIPDLWREVAAAATAGARIAVEHAALDARAPQVLLALALRELSRKPGSAVVLIVPDPEAVRFSLRNWFSDTRSIVRRLHASGGRRSTLEAWRVESGVLWLMAGSRPDVSSSPTTRLDGVFVADAHGLEADPLPTLDPHLTPTAPVVVAGVIADREAWPYQYGRARAELVSIDAPAILSAFPDQERRVYAKTDPRFRREMALEDVAIGTQGTPVATFCRRRLRVRTDKGPEYLSERQQREAENQLGSGWASGRYGAPVVTMELSYLQRKYLARKRLAVLQGDDPRYLVLKPRRLGVTTIEQAISYQQCVERPRSHVATAAHVKDAALRIGGLVSTFHQRDPYAPPLDAESKDALSFTTTGAKFFIGTAGARGFLRGETISRFHGSEVSKWLLGPRRVELVADLMAGVTEAVGRGEVVLETTANGQDWFYAEWEDAKAGRSSYTPIFIRWFDDPANVASEGTYDPEEIRDTLTDEEVELAQAHDLTLGQIAFRRRKQRDLKRLFPQEYPEDDVTCFLSTGLCYFDVGKVLDLARALPQDGDARQHIPGGYSVVWEEPQKGIEYALGCDTSEGVTGCDPNGFGILRVDTMEQVAAVHGLFSINDLADLVIEWALRYNKALAGVERENHGSAVLNRIIEKGHGTPHTRGGWLYYFTRKGDRDAMPSDARRFKGKPGWTTNENTRPTMLADLATAIEDDGGMTVRHRELLSEALAFKKQTNGRWEADSMAHDDTVMFWAIAVQVAKARKKRAGIG